MFIIFNKLIFNILDVGMISLICRYGVGIVYKIVV